MLNLDNIVSNYNTSSLEDNDWPFRMLIIGPSGSGKTNILLHLINDLHPIDKIYLYAKDLQEPKYKYLINKREQAGIKNFKLFLKLLLNIQMIWMMYLMILIIIIKIEIKKC